MAKRGPKPKKEKIDQELVKEEEKQSETGENTENSSPKEEDMTENEQNESEIEEKSQEIPDDDDEFKLEDRKYFSLDEAARYLGVTGDCAKLWFDHGHLRGTNEGGFVRVSRESIIRVSKSRLVVGPNM